MGGLVPPSGDPSQDPAEGAKLMLKMGAQVDQALLSMSQAMPDGAADFGQARKLIQTGLAKHLAKSGGPTATSPTEAGSQFPGGGMSTGLP